MATKNRRKSKARNYKRKTYHKRRYRQRGKGFFKKAFNFGKKGFKFIKKSGLLKKGAPLRKILEKQGNILLNNWRG